MKQTEAQNTAKEESTNNVVFDRRRRHFRDDYKRKVVADILSGKANIDTFTDNEGKKISKYLIQRWKAEFRGQKFMVDALSQHRGNFKQPIEIPKVELQPNNDMFQELMRLRNENMRLKQIIALDLGLKSDNNVPSYSYAR